MFKLNLKSISLLSMLALSFGIMAQDDVDNLVVNGDFENTNSRTLKKTGGLDEFCDDWFSATEAPADIFSRNVKSDKVGIPMNAYGIQEPSSGDHYAGFRAYSKDAKTTRTYLEVPFKKTLKKDVMYCVKFKVSLSDVSKYAVNNIGAYITTKKEQQKNTGEMVRDFQVKEFTNKVFKNQDDWETVCTVFTAKGDESHMIIGCFERDDKLANEKMKRPRGITAAQTYDAYYFVDEVEVFEIQAKSQCDCQEGKAPAPDVIYSRSVTRTDDMTNSQIIGDTELYFASLKAELNPLAKRDLDEVIKMLQSDPNIKLEVVGHCDNDEAKEASLNPMYASLGKKRADVVVEYIISQGISELRVVPRSKENTQPANTRPTPMSMAQNRRVQFIVR